MGNMAIAVKFDLVSPERLLTSIQAIEVQLPGADGDMTVMEGHAPTITNLRPGIVQAILPNGTEAFAVTGGFAEIGPKSVSVLAEQAVLLADVTAEMLDEMVAVAREAASASLPENRDAADKAVEDFLALRLAVGQ